MSKRGEHAHQARQHEAEARALWLERMHLRTTGHVAPDYAEMARDTRLAAQQADAERKASVCWGEANAVAGAEPDDSFTLADAVQALAFD
jgi:hypothetical protein